MRWLNSPERRFRRRAAQRAFIPMFQLNRPGLWGRCSRLLNWWNARRQSEALFRRVTSSTQPLPYALPPGRETCVRRANPTTRVPGNLFERFYCNDRGLAQYDGENELELVACIASETGVDMMELSHQLRTKPGCGGGLRVNGVDVPAGAWLRIDGIWVFLVTFAYRDGGYQEQIIGNWRRKDT